MSIIGDQGMVKNGITYIVRCTTDEEALTRILHVDPVNTRFYQRNS